MQALSGLSMTSLSTQGPSTSTHGQKKQGNFQASYFDKDSNLVGSGLWPLWPHLCFIFSFKSPSSHTTTLRVRVLVYEFWGDTDIQPITALLSLSVNTLISCFKGRERHIAETTSNSYHQIDNISCVWYCHFFFPSVTTQNGRVPLPSKDWLGSRSLPLPPQKSHSLLSSSPILKFTLLLALSQENLNLLLSSLLKNKNKKLSLGHNISLQLPPSLCPLFQNNLL